MSACFSAAHPDLYPITLEKTGNHPVNLSS
ncbi:hypothetical protein FHY29_003614 [Xanthomonas arboricola]